MPESPVRAFRTSRPQLTVLVWGFLFVALSVCARAQQDANDVPLGDVARTFRKKSVSPETIVDNDNLSKMVENAESLRAAAPSLVFSLDSGSKSFHLSSPDVTCSLSFTGKTASSLSDPPLLDELPRTELAKLEGPATIDGDSLQVSMHNGTLWELREIVIGLTIVKRLEAGRAPSYGQARVVAAAASSSEAAQDPFQKQPDVTLLLHVKGSAAPAATAVFRTALNFALFPDQEWHWAIVKAKGIPPQASLVLTEPLPAQNIGDLPAVPPIGPAVSTSDSAPH